MQYLNRFIAADTETGGLPNKTKSAFIDIALTEIAMVSVDNETLEIKDKASWLIKPYDENCEYNIGAEKASGISKKMCELEGIDVEQVYKNCVKFLKDNTVKSAKPIMIMQNKSFDIPFFENLFTVFNDDFHSYINRTEDTLDWCRLKWNEKPNYKLGSLSEYFELDLTEAHRAMPDTIATAKIWIELMKLLRADKKTNESQPVNSFRKGFKLG